MNQYLELSNGEIVLFLTHPHIIQQSIWTMEKIKNQLKIREDDFWGATDYRPKINLRDVIQTWIED